MTPPDDLAALAHMIGGTGRRLRPLAFIGSGATGAVYRVLDEDLHEVVALKHLHVLDPAEVYRLKREFRSLADVRHDNVVELYDLVVEEQACFFTMELVDGSNVMDYLRHDAPPASDRWLGRFLSVATQLLAGLESVHAAGRLHRDIKPSNVLVASSGRVVLLDFDLAVPIDGRALGSARWPSVAGTFEYMAPEQALGREVSAASDLYAVGALCYEALTGRVPHAGPPASVVAEKIAGTPAPPSTWRPDVPSWLDRLVVRLLEPDPQARPGLLEILDRLRAELPSRVTASAVAAPSLFVGREAEQQRLTELVARTAPHARIVHVQGESGIGKTQLVQEVIAKDESTRSTLVLRGRCLPQESVPYKGLDMVVDAMSRVLARATGADRRRLLGDGGPALARLFPVLGRIPGLAPSPDVGSLDVAELRRRGVEDFGGLLGRMASWRPVVVWIDDFQWADIDSAALLAMIIRSPAPPPIVLVLSYRLNEQVAPLLALLDRAVGDASGVLVDTLALGPLDPETSRHLASRVCPPSLRASSYVEAIAEQSGGSPFLLKEMGRHLAVQASDVPTPPRVSLPTVIEQRLARLPPTARRAVELVAVAGGPIERTLVLDLSGQDAGGRQMLASLERERLVRFTAAGGKMGIETQHDRIREAVLDTLSEVHRRERHREIAFALERGGASSNELLARHFHGAGLAGRAADYAVAAADEASTSLAFVRAAELYRLARTWDTRDRTWTRVLLAREADAMANAGHFAGSAAAFMAAADEAAPDDALELRRRACEQYLAGGELDAGLAVLDALLPDLRLPAPGGPTRTMLEIACRVMGFAISSRRIRPAQDVDPRDQQRIDTCYAVAKSLVDADAVRGVYFSVQALRLALQAGDAERIARGLCLVGGSMSASGDRVFTRIGALLMRRARDLARDAESNHLLGTMAVAEGQVLMLKGRWTEALDRSEHGLALLERCRDSAAERMVGQFAILRALEDLGAHVRLVERATAVLQAATAVGNRYATVFALHQLVLSRLALGDLAAARTTASRSRSEWATSGVQIQHVYRLRAEAHCDLWEGRPDAALARLDAEWRAMRASGLLRIALVRVDVWFLRARVLLAVAATRRSAGYVIRRVLRDGRRLARERRPDASAHAALLGAGAASLRGDRAATLQRLEAAERAYDDAGMRAYAACCLHRRGEVLGRAGKAMQDAAAARLTACGIETVGPWLDLCAPGRFAQQNETHG